MGFLVRHFKVHSSSARINTATTRAYSACVYLCLRVYAFVFSLLEYGFCHRSLKAFHASYLGVLQQRREDFTARDFCQFGSGSVRV